MRPDSLVAPLPKLDTNSTCNAWGLGRARILHLPGELFVEYQLAAKAMRSDLFVTMAAYGDYAPWYIARRPPTNKGGYVNRS